MFESASLAALALPAPRPPVTNPDGFPALVIAGGPRNGETLVIDGQGMDRVLGSAPDCHLRFGGSSVDHHHATVTWEDTQGLVINDQGSASGTWVNGERVAGQRVLQDGDRISLGPPGSAESVKLLVQVPPQMEAPLVLDADEPMVLEGDTFELPSDNEDDVFDASAQAPAAPAPEPVHARPAAPSSPAIIFEDEEPARRPTATYSDELPSIAPERSREPVRSSSGARPLAPVARKGSSLPLPLIIGGVALLVLGGGGYFLFSTLHKPRPALLTVMPQTVAAGQMVSIDGTDFAETAAGNVVRFGEEKGVVSTATATRLTVVVPNTLGGAKDTAITVETKGGRSNALKVALRTIPLPTGLEPDVALPGTEVVIKGQMMDRPDVAVTVAGLPATVQQKSATQISFVVPRIENLIEGQGVLVLVRAGGENGKPLTLTMGRLPLLNQVEPNRGEAGNRVTLRGRGFDPNLGGNAVTFADEPALVLSASDREMEVIVPALPLPGNQFKAPMKVTARGASSAGLLEFTMLRPSAGTFLPRFFAAAVREDPARVFVASEAGPLFLLSVPDGAASTAQRAMNVANALSPLFREGAPPAVIEVRGEAVAVAGQAEVLVRATAEDAAGYSQPWNTVMKGQRATGASLAAHWAALLQDYVTLFQQHQRPTRMVEVTPRGRVLLDLQSEGERRTGAGGGVPAGFLSPPASTLAAALRELALAVPGRGQAIAGAALVGRWTGTMEETGIALRPLKLTLRLDGTKLAGAVSSTAGQVTMEIPIQAVSYEKGLLSFDVAGGPLRHFRGTPSGSTIAGSIFDKANKEIGRFSLKYGD